MAEQTYIRQDGNGPAFSRELGCLCGRCRAIQYDMTRPSGKLEEFVGWPDPPCRAGTSASILTGIDSLVKAHILIDVGPGVGDSLASSMIEGLENLSAVLASHWHPDHIRPHTVLLENLPKGPARAQAVNAAARQRKQIRANGERSRGLGGLRH